ncbi:MAG: type IV pilus twitching motility protein PilT [Phycisphaerae bacterium]|nr:type IV pilus twitching motility protein PilT [Phycisphaerae bacterium]
MKMSIEQLLRYLLDQKGSDLHLKAALPPAIRVHGTLKAVEAAEPFTPDELKEAIYALLSPGQIDKFENSPTHRNELDFAHGLAGVGRFRFNIHRQRGTIAAIVRAVPNEIPKLEDLHLHKSIEEFCDLEKGLLLVTGPTGSGKSTTLAAIIDRINATRAAHIITIEDPVEFLHRSQKSFVTQREVGENADTLSFRNALKSALRQDPDIILVGEMRDFDTIGIALTAAETGHLVLGTLHTPSAPQTISRIIDVFPADQQPQVAMQLSATLVGVVAQILLPTPDGRGRVVAAEVMKSNAAVRNLIRENKVDALYQTMDTGAADGMITMDRAIVDLVSLGKLSYDVAVHHLRTKVARKQIEPFRDMAA